MASQINKPAMEAAHIVFMHYSDLYPITSIRESFILKASTLDVSVDVLFI